MKIDLNEYIPDQFIKYFSNDFSVIIRLDRIIRKKALDSPIKSGNDKV